MGILREAVADIKKKQYLCSRKMQSQMKDIWTKLCKHVAAMMMLLLFVGYYADVNLFVHTHIVNGVTIVHSHVHKSSHHNSTDGGHTSSEITLIANLSSQLLTTGASVDMVISAQYEQIATIGCETPSRTTSAHLLCTSLRAPPEHAA